MAWIVLGIPLYLEYRSNQIEIQGKSQNSKPKNSKPILFVDEDFNVDDIVMLNKIASRYEEEKWLRITSRFFDKTGKRITLEQAKSRVAAVSE